MKKLLATILMVAACGTASAAEFNLSGQYGLMTDKDYGQHLAGVQVSLDDIHEGVGVYGGHGKIRGGNIPSAVNNTKDYISAGVTYKATDKLVTYVGLSRAKYSGKTVENVKVFTVTVNGKDREIATKTYNANNKQETGIEVGMRYRLDSGVALGLGYNSAPKALFATVGWTFK